MNAIAPWDFSMEAGGLDVEKGPGHIVYLQQLYFSQTNVSGRILARANNESMDTVPPGIFDAHSFIEHDGHLFFFGKNVADGGECFWGIRGSGDATLIQQFQPGFQLRHLRREENAFLFEAVGLCGTFRSTTRFSSNGTLEGTQATEGDFPELVDLCLKLASGMEFRPPTSRLLAILFLGILPQTGLAAYLLIKKKVPGVFLNVFLGAYAVTFFVWILMKGPVVNLLFFLQASTMTYAAAACVAVAVNQVLWSKVSETFIQELGTWATAVTSIAFFGAVHLALKIPSEGWTWPLYGILHLPQIAFALLMRRLTPMALFVTGLLVLLYKAVFELTPSATAEWAKALQLAIFYGLGGFVLLILVVYRDNKAFLEELVYQRLRPSVKSSDVSSFSEAEQSKSAEPLLEPEEDEQESWLILEQLPWLQLLQLQRHLSAPQETKKAEDEEDC